MPFSSVLGASSVIKPGVCTSTNRPTVPYEGQLIYETDTDRVAAYNGSAWVGFDTTWQTYTPTYAGFTVGNATVVARYIEIGKFGYAYVSITLGSTSSVSAVTAMTISNPSTMALAGIGATTPIGQCEFRDTGTNSFSGIVGYASTTTVQPRNFSVSGSLIVEATSIISNVPFTWTNGDIIFAHWFYHKA